MWPFKTKQKKKPEKIDKKENAIKRALSKLSKLKYNKEAIKSLSQLLRDFFSEYLNLRYQFTYKELEEELKERKIKKGLKVVIESLLEELSETEFDDHEKITRAEFKVFVNKFRQIIKALHKG